MTTLPIKVVGINFSAIVVFEYEYFFHENTFKILSTKHWPHLSERNVLYATLLMLKLEYYGRTRPISYRDHQQPWYLQCRIKGPLPSTTNDFKYLCHLSADKMIQNGNMYSYVSLN